MCAAAARIEEINPAADEDLARACYQIEMSAWAIDNPGLPPLSFETYHATLHDFDGTPRHAFLARDSGGEPVGWCMIRLPSTENQGIAFCSVTVALDRRRTGIGSALLAHCVTQAKAASRARLSARAFDETPGAAFAAANGAVAGKAEVTRTLNIDADTQARLGRLRPGAEKAAAGYELLSWQASTPEEHLSQVAHLLQFMADAPRDDRVDGTVWNTDRVRAVEATSTQLGLQVRTVVARERASGTLAALTQVILAPGMPEWAVQQDTVVLPAHRGQRLGLLVKIAMMNLLAEEAPQLRHIITGNAGENEHMIAINTQLGYEVSGVGRAWELGLA